MYLKLFKVKMVLDGAAPHRTNAAMDYLKQIFGENIIHRHSFISQPPDSPDVSILDNCLWHNLRGTKRLYIIGSLV